MSMTSGPTEPLRTGKAWLSPPRFRVAWSSAILLSFHPVRDAGEAFLPPEQNQHIENPRRGRPAGERRSKRLSHLAELHAVCLRHSAHRRLCGERRPFVKRREDRVKTGEQAGGIPDDQLRRLFVQVERPGAEKKGRPFREFVEGLRARLQFGHGAGEE